MDFLHILNFFGGLALFLFGMNKMSENLQAVAGSEMRLVLKQLTGTPLRGAMVGMGFTALVQSSSATTVMMIGLVNAGIMTLNQAVGVIMGANIGSTVTAQLIAFNLERFAFAFVIAGVVLLFIKKSRTMERWSSVVLGFGLIFLGFTGMSAAVVPLKESYAAHQIIAQLSSNPIYGILTGVVFTMLLQSSAASIGILIVLANAGLISFEGALYIVYGDNIGTTVTAWLAGIGANSTARRVALVHTLFNVFGTIIFGTLTYLGLYTSFINFITPGNVFKGVNVARHIANAHTFFNVFNTILFLPFSGALARLAERIIPKRDEETITLGEPKHLNYHLVGDSDLALGQVIKEMQEMLKLVQLELSITFESFREKNYRKQQKVAKVENAIDNLQREITRYLVTVNERTNAQSVIRKIPGLLHTVNDIEKLGDYTEELNGILNTQIQSQKSPISQEFLDILEDMEGRILSMLSLSIQYMEGFKPSHTFKIIEMEGRINERHFYLRDKILRRIQNGECDAESGLNTIDFIDCIELLGNKMENLVKAGTHDFLYYIHPKDLEEKEEENQEQ